MELSIRCNYCNHKYLEHVYSNLEVRHLRCPRCDSKGRDLAISQTNSAPICKDCHAPLKDDEATRCNECWEARIPTGY